MRFLAAGGRPPVTRVRLDKPTRRSFLGFDAEVFSTEADCESSFAAEADATSITKEDRVLEEVLATAASSEFHGEGAR
jgi:hypothetical protein